MNYKQHSKKQLAFTMIGRGLLAVGGLALIARKLSNAKDKRSWPMMALGAASAIPLAMGVVQNIKEVKSAMAEAA